MIAQLGKKFNEKEEIIMKHTIFTPYRVCPLGAHVDHQLGQVTGFAIDRGVELEFDITEDGTFDLISKNYPGHIMFTLVDELEREMLWGISLKLRLLHFQENMN